MAMRTALSETTFPAVDLADIRPAYYLNMRSREYVVRRQSCSEQTYEIPHLQAGRRRSMLPSDLRKNL